MKEPKIGEVYKFIMAGGEATQHRFFQIIVEIENEEIGRKKIVSWKCDKNFQNWNKMKENKNGFWDYDTKIVTALEKIRVIKSFTLWKMSNERT